SCGLGLRTGTVVKTFLTPTVSMKDWLRRRFPGWNGSGGVLVAPVVSVSIGCNSLEPISKSPEEDNEASELYEAEEVVGVVFPTDEDAALPLNPSKEALHEPTSHIAA